MDTLRQLPGALLALACGAHQASTNTERQLGLRAQFARRQSVHAEEAAPAVHRVCFQPA
jgi:hypothetical protein